MLPSQGGKHCRRKIKRTKREKNKTAQNIVETQQNTLQHCLDLRLSFCFGLSSFRGSFIFIMKQM